MFSEIQVVQPSFDIVANYTYSLERALSYSRLFLNFVRFPTIQIHLLMLQNNSALFGCIL